MQLMEVQMKAPSKRGKYTLACKLEAVRLVRSGQSAAVVSCTVKQSRLINSDFEG